MYDISAADPGLGEKVGDKKCFTVSQHVFVKSFRRFTRTSTFVISSKTDTTWNHRLLQ